MSAPSLGIDFGTSNCSMAWYDPRSGTAEIILNAQGQPKTPSAVYFGEGETLVGEPVENLLEDVSTDRGQREEVFRRTVRSIKRNLVPPIRMALPGGRFVKPVEVAAEILKKLKRDAEEGHFHEPIRRTVITCPAEFNVLQRREIEAAGKLAGFEEVVLLEEPVAGALAYARAGLGVGRHVLVYDLGGGTFDLAVLDNEEESFHVAMEPKGIERCGGDDFDVALYHHCDEMARRELGRPISPSGSMDLSFLRECRRRKESLAYQERGRFSNYLSTENGPVRFEHEVDRETFEGLIEGYVETTTRLTEEIIKQAGLAGHEVDTVVLIGGSSRVRLVTETLKGTLPVDPLGFDKKDVAVALGAAHYTSVRWGGARKNPAPPDARRDAAAGTGVRDATRLDQYRAKVEEASGRGLDKVESDRLGAFARQLGLGADEAAGVERAVLGDTQEGVLYGQYREAVRTAWSDGKLHVLEAEWLDARAGELGLGREQTSRAEDEVMGAAKEAFLARQGAAPVPSDSGSYAFIRALEGHSGGVHAVAFNSDGRFLASGASDHAVRGWDAIAGRAVGTLAGHAGRVNSVAFGPGGVLLASGGSDKTVRLWKLPNGEPSHVLHHPDWILAVAFAPDGGLLAAGGADREVRLWDTAVGEQSRVVSGHSHWVLAVAFGPGGRYLASGSADGTAAVWEVATGERVRTLEHPNWVRSVAFGGDGRVLITACEDGKLRVWDVESGECLLAVTGHSGPALCVAASPDGRMLASGGADGKVKIWDPGTGEPLQVLSAHRGGVGAVAFASDGGRLLASAGHDRAIKLWGREGPRDDATARYAPRGSDAGSPRNVSPGPPPGLSDRPSDLPF